MRKKLPVAILLLFVFVPGLVALGLAACSPGPQPPPAQKVKVAATIFPLADFARQVGGERVTVEQLLPAGAEPHSWEPSPRDVACILNAQAFIFNGAGLEPWVEKLRDDLIKKGILVVEASAGLNLLPGEGRAHHSHPPEAVDPHVWLDPVLAAEIVQKIAGALAEIDPAGRDYYAERAQQYRQELSQLDEEYRKGLSGLAVRKIVVSHEAFGYLARRYGLEQIGVMGLSPQSEPTPERVKKVITICRQHNVRYVFFESQVSPRLAEAIAREVGARTLVLHPIGNLTPEQQARGDNYLSIMRENLENLKTALGGK